MRTTTLFLTLLFFAGDPVFSQVPDAYYEAAGLSVEVLTPDFLWSIQGRARQKKQTWAKIETEDGDSTIAMGYLELVSRNDTLPLYRIDGRIVAIPADRYYMPRKILLDRKGRPQEMIRIGSCNDCPCAKGTNLMFGPDSVTTNVANRRYKLVMNLDALDWRTEHSFNPPIYVPGIPTELLLEIDSVTTKAYGLAFETEDGATCDIIWFGEYPWQTPKGMGNQIQRYEVPSESWRRFDWDGERHTFDGVPIQGYKIVTDEPAEKPGGGVKKRKHARRVRRF